MMRREILLLACAGVLAAVSADVDALAEDGHQDPEAVVAPAPEDLPEAVAELFEETDDDGAPIIPPELQAYFAGLPTHAQGYFADAVDEGLISGTAHARRLLSLQLDADKMELVLTDNCILCHSDPDMQMEETLLAVEPDDPVGPAHLSLPEFLSDVHFRKGLSCSGCHGGKPTDTEMSDEIYERWPEREVRIVDRTWIPEFCGRCHADPGFMRQYNPAIATDQLAKYRTSRHGELLFGRKDSKVAQCVSCHGVHGIRGPQSRRSKVHPVNIPETCGACHADPEYMAGYRLEDGRPLPTDQLAQYRESVHGKALLERGDLGAPACNDCHGNHAARPPQVAYVSQVCRTCHSGNGSLFDGSRHKKAFAEHGWPECETCHGKHDIQPAADALLDTQPGGLCHDCHTQYATDNPNCIKTADHFRETILELSEALEYFEHESEWLAERGLNAEPVQATAEILHDAVRQTRSTIHAFDRSDFDEVAAQGQKAVEQGHVAVEAALGEYHFRRKGLTLSIVVMALLALGLWLKIRQIES